MTTIDLTKAFGSVYGSWARQTATEHGYTLKHYVHDNTVSTIKTGNRERLVATTWHNLDGGMHRNPEDGPAAVFAETRRPDEYWVEDKRIGVEGGPLKDYAPITRTDDALASVLSAALTANGEVKAEPVKELLRLGRTPMSTSSATYDDLF